MAGSHREYEWVRVHSSISLRLDHSSDAPSCFILIAAGATCCSNVSHCGEMCFGQQSIAPGYRSIQDIAILARTYCATFENFPCPVLGIRGDWRNEPAGTDSIHRCLITDAHESEEAKIREPKPAHGAYSGMSAIRLLPVDCEPP